MDEKTQRERLEQELRFLKESYEAEVISKEEFEKGKERIELKLKEINNDKKEGEFKDEDTDTKESGKESIKEAKENESSIRKEDEQKKEAFKGNSESKFFKYAIVFIILILAIFFVYVVLKEKKETKVTKETGFIAVCTSDSDCKQEGMEGTCLSQGTKDAKCEFKEILMINVLIVNDRKNCFNCDTMRILSILESWFDSVNAKEIDYNTNEGRELIEKFDVKMLPFYILDENITRKQAFGQSKQAFINKKGSYSLSDDASGSSFYFRRPNEQNKLDLFLNLNDANSIQAEKNLQEFLGSFKEVKFEKHINDSLTRELGIKVYPTFLINNRIKFTGAQPAEVIKENFCKLNKLSNCNLTLPKNLT